jgi:SAM-dependent methyltransferase
MPFVDESFDAVLCQFGLMFFEDRAAGLREMMRVVRPGGRLAVAVWSGLDATPGYAAVVELLERLFGEAIADALRAPFALGDPRKLEGLCKASGIDCAEIRTVEGMARFPSIDAWMYTDIKGWTLADRIDDRQFARLLAEARPALGRFALADGRVEFPAPALIATASKPQGETISDTRSGVSS